MQGVKIEKIRAEELRKYLRAAGLLDLEHKIFSNNDLVYIPLIARPGRKELNEIKKLGGELCNVKFQKQTMKRGESIRKLIKEDLPKAYDLLGNIAVINETKHAKKLAKAILQANPNVKTVVMKKSAVSGKYRTREFVHILGKRNFVAAYRENGAMFVFDIRKVFFSSRLAYERKRIAELVAKAKKAENVMVMFAGVGPFAIEIAKACKACNVVAIELNANAYKSMVENIKLNKVTNVVAVKGDVAKAVEKYKGWADRIVMPLPKSAYSFLGSVLVAAKDRCVVHYYCFGKAKQAVEENEQKIKEFFEERGKKVKFLFSRVVRPYSPSEDEVVIDFEIRSN
ncbi:MAG: class I SAM-dependent methyltransferase [Candidatus Micrarchaeia archaeon]